MKTILGGLALIVGWYLLHVVIAVPLLALIVAVALWVAFALVLRAERRRAQERLDYMARR